MSWAALLLAGVVLAQVPPTASGLPGDAPAFPQVGEPSRSPAGGVASDPPVPGIGYGGAYSSESSGAQAPLPAAAEPWKASSDTAPAGSLSGQVGLQVGGQVGGQTPAGSGGVGSPGAGASAPSSGPSNVWQRLQYLDQLRANDEAAKKAPTPNVESPYGASQQPRTPASGLGLGGTDPVPSQRTGVYVPVAARMSGQELLEQAMMLPAGTPVAGRRVTLLDVLGSVTERAKRIEIAHAYWQLARAVGEYRFCWDESERIQSSRLGTIDSGLLRSAQLAAHRELTAAELAVVQAQYLLAEAAGLDSSSDLPLPGDRPHLGKYSTYFERIYVDQTSPASIRLIHRILPLQFQVINVRAEAVDAAEDALQAVARSYQANLADAADLLGALRETTTQRRAWITAVAKYNHSIADYGLSIAGPETTGRELISILIKLSRAEPSDSQDKSADSSTALEPSALLHANSASAVAEPTDTAATRPGVPTLAPPRGETVEASASQAIPPVPVDPLDEADLAVEPALSESPVAGVDDVATDPAVVSATLDVPVPESDAFAAAPEGDEAAAVMSRDEGTSSDSVAEGGESVVPAVEAEEPPSRPGDLVVQTRPMVAVEETDAPQRVQTVFRPPVNPTVGRAQGRHADLVGLSPGIQAKRLTATLQRLAEAGGPQGEAVDLEACLDGVAGDRRRAVIEAYWEACLRMAQYEAYRQRVELLDGLVEVVTLGAAGTADAAARLKTARLDADADLLAAESRLLTTQYELTRRCGRGLEGLWLLPKTMPHTGTYRLRLESQPRPLAESWTLKRLAAVIPALGDSVKDHAQAVVQADSRRAETVAAYRAQTLRFDRVLSAVNQQAEETLEFLNVVSAYNQSIADYVTAVVPSALPEEQLVATLVVVR